MEEEKKEILDAIKYVANCIIERTEKAVENKSLSYNQEVEILNYMKELLKALPIS